MRAIRCVLIAAAITVTSAAARAQSLSGRVVSADDGAPLANVRIDVDGADDQPAERTDKDGRFTLPPKTDRTAGFRISKAGYAKKIVNADGLAAIRLDRGAVISGHVRDEYGTPLPFVRIVAERRTAGNGRGAFEQESIADTDDTGEYRLHSLPAGAYIVAISGIGVVMGAGGVVQPGRRELRPTRFYPDTPEPETAQVFTLTAGGDIGGIDFSIGGPVAPPGTPPPAIRSGGAGIRGHVSRPDGSPARRARIEVASTDRLFSPVTTVSDLEGTYQVAVPPGTYFVSAIDIGFTSGRYAKNNWPDGVTVTASTVTDAVDIVVPPAAAITGRIVDEFGDPIDGVRVAIEVVRFDRGRRVVAPAFGVSPAHTDDRGRFRIFRVPQGRYLVRAARDAATDLGTYFPGTVSASDATGVEIVAGQESMSIEFALTSAHAARIAGRVVTAQGEPFSGAVHLLASRRSGAIGAAAPRKVVAEDGAFVFDGLAPGEYVIQAATSRRVVSAEGEFGAAFVNVASGDAANVIVRMTAGSAVRGRIRFDGGDPPDRSAIDVSTISADPDFASLADNPAARADIHDDWTFEMSGLNGPRRVVVSRMPEGWMLQSITAAGADVTDEALPFGRSAQSVSNLEIVLTTQMTEIAGFVTADGTASRAFALVAFPEDTDGWYQTSRFIAFGRSDVDGAFTLSGLPPGRYFIAAFDDRDMPDPATATDNIALLRTLQPRAARVSIAPGQHTTVTLARPPR